jgi:hypothetical protein
MNMETSLRGRPRNRLQNEVREDGRIVGEEGWKERIYKRGMGGAADNGKKSSHSAYDNGINEYTAGLVYIISVSIYT